MKPSNTKKNTSKEDISKQEHTSSQPDVSNIEVNLNLKYERYEVQNTPFVVVEEPNEVEMKSSYTIVVGKYRVSETFDTLHEAMEDANNITWNRIIQVLWATLEMQQEMKERDKENLIEKKYE